MSSPSFAPPRDPDPSSTTNPYPPTISNPFITAIQNTPPPASSSQADSNPTHTQVNKHNHTDASSWTQAHTHPSTQHQTAPQTATQNIYTPSQSSQTSLNEPIQEHQILSSQLQQTNSSQAELITDLRIRIAVLENELTHSRKDKLAVEGSLGIVIESLTRIHTSNPTSNSNISQLQTLSRNEDLAVGVGNAGDTGDKVKGLEKEIDRLRKENKSLRRQPRLQPPNFLSHAPNTGDLPSHPQVHFRSRTPVQIQPPSFPSSSIPRPEKGKEKQQEQESFENGIREGVNHGLEAEKFIGSWGNPSFAPNSISNSHSFAGPPSCPNHNNFGTLNHSFGSGSTTVPNTPILKPVGMEVEMGRGFADVGFHSLEENMDGLLAPLSFSQADGNEAGVGNERAIGNGEEEEGKDIDEQLAEQQKAMEKFVAVPKPRVLKVGFEVEGSKRGSDYDLTSFSSNTKAREYQRSHTMRDYNRFALPSLPKDASQLSEFFDLHLSKDSGEEEEKRRFAQAGGEALWISPEEREDAIRLYQRTISPNTTKNFVDFFRYGIAYLPTDADTNYFRTIHISPIPLRTTLRELLSKVRGGEIVSASLLDTSSITDSQTAIVQFVHENAASEFVAFANAHPLFFADAKVPVQVTLIQTPTWPLSIPSRRRIHEHKQTRCLSISNFPSSLSLEYMIKDLAYGNAFRAASLIGVDTDAEGTVWLEFSSISAAGAAFGILTSRSNYSNCIVGFAEDPCSRPLEEILSSAPVGNGMRRVLELSGVGDGELKVSCRKCRDGFESNNSLYSHLREVHAVGGFKGLEFGVGAELLEEQRKRLVSFSGTNDELVREVQGMQRRRLAALSNQKVEIPSFSGKAIEGASWADEVIEEASLSSPNTPTFSTPTVPPNSPIHSSSDVANNGEEGQSLNAIMVDNVNEMMAQGCEKWWKDEGLRKPPVGLAGSKYASLVPSFEDLGQRPRFGRQANPKSSSASTSQASDSANDKSENAQRGNDKEEAGKLQRSLSHHDIALQRLAVLDNHAPIPVPFPLLNNHNTHNGNGNSNGKTKINKPNTSPPRVNLSNLLASSSSSSSNPTLSPPSNPHPRLPLPANHDSNIEVEEPVRMPKGPNGYGFELFGDGGRRKGKGIGRYNNLEAEKDELNLRISSPELGVDGLSASGGSEGARNPDEILLDLEEDADREGQRKNGEEERSGE